MEPKSNKNFAIVFILLFIAVLGIFWYANSRKAEPIVPDTTGQNGDVTPHPTSNPNIVVDMPTPNQSVNGEMTIKGKAKLWYFEGSFPYRLVDDRGNTLSEGPVQAQGEWMTTEFVPFEEKIMFYTDRPSGKLILMKDNPSGDAKLDESIEIPLIFTQMEGMTVKAYFGNEVYNPNQIDCSRVYPVERRVVKSPQTATASLRALLEGLNRAEYNQGFSTSINSGTELRSIRIENGTAYADFNNMLGAGVAGSCRVTQIRSQIESTLKQFPTVNNVVISIEGQSEGILQP